MSTDSNLSDSSNQEVVTKKVKLGFENWREVVLLLHDVLLWRNKPVYPGLIFGVSSIIFLIIYIMDSTILSCVSFFAFCGVTLDYVGPMVIPKIYAQESWNGSKEKQYTRICSSIASYYILFLSYFSWYTSMRKTRPKMYYSVTLSALFFFTWFGSVVNNTFFSYILVTFMLLFPGLKQNGILEKCSELTKQYIAKGLRMVSNTKEKTK